MIQPLTAKKACGFLSCMVVETGEPELENLDEVEDGSGPGKYRCQPSEAMATRTSRRPRKSSTVKTSTARTRRTASRSTDSVPELPGISTVNGDSALNFTLLVGKWEPRRKYKFVSDLNVRIESLLHERGTPSERALNEVHRQSSTR